MKKIFGAAIASLLLAGPSLALTLEERNVARFSEAAVAGLLEMDFVHRHQDIANMDEFFADRASYEEYAAALRDSGMPDVVGSKYLIATVKNVSVNTVTPKVGLADTFLVSGTLTRHFQGSKNANQEQVGFNLELIRNGEEFGVKRLTVN